MPTPHFNAPKPDEIWPLIRAAKRLDNPVARSGDVDYFLTDGDDAEGDDRLDSYGWFELEVPINFFGCHFTPDELGVGNLAPDTDREAKREADLLAWVESVGGWKNALQTSPVVATFGGKYVRLVDGWHRSKLAKVAGLETVTAVVGLPKSVLALL